VRGPSWSKWSKHLALLRDARLRRHLPATRLLGEASFRRMTAEWGAVILKPTSASGGAGVMLAAAAGRGAFRFRIGRSVRRIAGRARLRAFLKHKAARPYLVQRRIRLAEIGGRPIDFRVMVQRPRGGGWRMTGIVAKVAGRGYIVTNVARSGGRILTAGEALRRAAVPGGAAAVRKRIARVSLRAAAALARKYPYIRTIGFDIGVDRRGRVWIIEANFAPMLSLFSRLGNKTMFRRIVRLGYRG